MTGFDKNLNLTTECQNLYGAAVQTLFRAAATLRLFGLLAILGTAAGPALSAELHYLPNSNLVMVLLPPPPGPNSAEQQADLAEVLAVHPSAKFLEPSITNAEKHVSAFTFAPVVGDFFQTNQFPKSERFFHRVLLDAVLVIDTGKDYWERPRPYVIDTNLVDGPPEKFSGSYPSGHSTLGTVFSLILSEIFPEKAEAILSKGREIGWHRVILGKHYPTDIYAGRVLGQRIVQEMQKNRQFRRDLKEATIEIRSWLRRNQGLGGSRTTLL
jgi:acid phosphatase (class A)